MKTLKKQLIVAVVIVLLITNMLSIVSCANFNIESAHLESKGSCGDLLKKNGNIVNITYVVYNKNGKEYPAYCLERTDEGVGEKGSYTVSVNSLVNNVGVWKAIVNGYPYKTYSQLGCANEREAFAATKMAVYSMLEGYSISEFTGIGDAGARVLAALDTILKNVQTTSSKISSDLILTSDYSQLDTDKINSKYISQTYKVTANAPMQNYTVNISGTVPEGTLITDEQNNVKEEFTSNEKFKILIPIERLGNGGTINIKVNSGVETKPVFYGTAPYSNYQDYAIAGFYIEDGDGEINLNYSKNETKLKIFKKDSESTQPLLGAKFDLLDSNKNILYTNLTTNDKGEILVNNLLPGVYYLKETKAPNDYELYEDYIKLEIGFNEELYIIVNNTKGQKPTVEVTKNKVEVKQQKTQPKLPKTGM